jgi:peroxiredoxin Q/BCP
VLGISADSVSKQKKFKEKYGLPFHLLADVEKKMCSDYGVMKEKSMYGRKYMGIARMTFLLSADGKIAKMFEDVKPAEHATEVLAALKEL